MYRIQYTIILLALLLASCAGQVQKPPAVDAHAAARVLVFREPAFNAALASLYFGEGEIPHAELDNSEYKELQYSPGPHSFFVTADASKKYYFDVELMQGSLTCIRAFANPKNLLKVLTPFLMNLTNAFKAEVVECPSEDYLSEYARRE